MSENERNPKEILAEIQAGLDADTVAERQAALDALHDLPYGSTALLRKLERMALDDRSKTIRESALAVVTLPLYRQIQARQSNLPTYSRRMIVDEIIRWQADGLLDEPRAAVLRERYAFDFEPAPAKKAPAQPKADPAKPKATLAQTLVSETSIKVALYLGAFFIIASAAIFAVLVEVLRLPILLFFTLLFGGGALLLKKKLPQPSFTFFIIFSVLLPIDFSVLADQLNLAERPLFLYWFFVYLLMTALWGFATWFFRSRFFSLMAFVALDISFYNFVRASGNGTPIERYLLFLTFVGLLAIGGATLLKRFCGVPFSV